jgi:eukaryotic-like serine/threonine-protein kinase
MSPEQIEGKEADARSDIFALGAVLYEMATGQRAFEGKSRIAVASAILEKNPPLVTTLQPSTPPALAYIISTCLAKDPDERFQTAHDVSLQLRWLSQSGPIELASLQKQKRSRQLMGTVALELAAVIVLALLAFKLSGNHAAGSALGTVRFTLPQHQELASSSGESIVLSPDSKRLAYIAAENGASHLYVRRLDQFEAVAIPDSEGAVFPFFSPTEIGSLSSVRDD